MIQKETTGMILRKLRGDRTQEEIAAVVIDDEATLKRVNYYPEKNLLILKAENPDYEDLVYTGEQLDHIIILGKAVAFQSDVR